VWLLPERKGGNGPVAQLQKKHEPPIKTDRKQRNIEGEGKRDSFMGFQGESAFIKARKTQKPMERGRRGRGFFDGKRTERKRVLSIPMRERKKSNGVCD